MLDDHMEKTKPEMNTSTKRNFSITTQQEQGRFGGVASGSSGERNIIGLHIVWL
jgi:hypothetical protein